MTADPNGEYVFPSLPTGHYTVMAEVTGFKTLALSNIALGVDQRARIDLKLETGATIPQHARSEQEVIFVQSGTLEFTWDGGKLIMGAGDTLTVPVGLMHGFRNPASADAIAFVIRGAASPAAPQFAENRAAAE